MFFPLVGHAADKGEKPVKFKALMGEAKTAIKAKKGQAEAEKKLMGNIHREDITTEQRAEAYFMAEELQRSLNEAENVKLYLKQAYDTARFFSTILRMHEYLLACDSAESLPGKDGTVRYRYRSRGRDILLAYHANLLNGGKFLLKRDKYAEAYPYFDMYLTVGKSAFLADIPAVQGDTLLPRVAYWATVAGYNASQPRLALKYIDEAIAGADSVQRVSLQEYKVRCYESLGDKEKWVDGLVEGCRLYPGHDYFFLHLMDVYAQEKMYDEGLLLCQDMLGQVGERAIYRYGESQMCLAKQDYDGCITAANAALQLDTTMTDAYYNKGIAYLNKAVLFAETACTDIRNPKCRKDRATLMQLYRDAKEPMEEVRRRMPDDSKRWAAPLYRIYLNLNMGKEFAEMEKILNAQ